MGINLLTNWLLELMYATASPFYTLHAFFIQTTLYASVTALFIILFKLLFKNRLKARWHFLIWVVLLVRLVVPVLPSSPVSVFNTVKVDEEIRQSSYQSYTESNFDEEIGDDTYSVALGLQKMVEADNSKGDFQSETLSGYTIRIDAIVTYIWTGGVFLLLGYFTVILIIHRKRLKKSRRSCDADTDSILEKCKEKLNIKRNVSLYYADTTPVLIGLFKPAIYVPDTLSQSELEATLLHELNHMKHLDILWSWVAAVVLCLNWFNPIIWFSFFLFKRDLEVYCDERTLRYTENKQSYAMLLLKTATAHKERFVLGTTSLQSGKADVKRRIKFMAKYKKPTVALAVVAVVLAGVLATVCLTNPHSTEQTVHNPNIGDESNPAATIQTELINEKIDGVDLSYSSSLYLKSDFENAVEAITATFNSFGSDAGTLYELTYKGDDYSENELDYCNKLKGNDEPLYTDCMVFGSLFHTEKNAGGAWNSDSDYTWDWYLARNNGGEWKVVSYGY